MAKAPGIKRPHVLMDDFITQARTDPLLIPPVKLAPLPQIRRKGLRLLIRRLAYFVLART